MIIWIMYLVLIPVMLRAVCHVQVRASEDALVNAHLSVMANAKIRALVVSCRAQLAQLNVLRHALYHVVQYVL